MAIGIDFACGPWQQKIEGAYRRLCKVLDRIDLSHFPIPLSVEPVRDFMRIGVIVQCWVHDRDRPSKVLPIGNTQVVDENDDDAAIVDKVRTAALALLEHELLEQLRFDGKRIYDPHPPPSPFSTIMLNER